MFCVKSGCIFLISFSVVHSQMDVTLKRKPANPITYDELPNQDDTNLQPDDFYLQSQELLKRHERIQEDLKNIGAQLDSEIKDKFGMLTPPLHPNILDGIFNEQDPIQGIRVLPKFSLSMDPEDSDDDSSDEENPILNAIKFMNPMKFGPFGPRLSGPISRIDPSMPANGEGHGDIEPIGVLTIIKIDDGSPLNDNNNEATSVGDIKTISKDSEMESSLVDGFVKSFMNTMRDMVDLVHNTSISLNGVVSSTQNRSEAPIDIKIEDHGRTYDIPSDALVERTEPDFVNITWRSELKGFNNSLSMNVSKGADGKIVFHRIRLRMLNRQGLQEYNSTDPVRVGQNKDNSTEINLADGIGLRFPDPDSLDVVVVEKRGRFSGQWMAVSIALLGLLVAALVMFLSYILHTRNRYYARKDSMAKVPIA